MIEIIGAVLLAVAALALCGLAIIILDEDI